jgi:hypothetical protein
MRLPHGAGQTATLVLCAITVAPLAHAQSHLMPDGWTLTIAVTSDSGAHAKPKTTLLRHRFAGHLLRMDSPTGTVQTASGAHVGLPYFIYDDSAHTRTLVDPRDRRASVTNESATPNRSSANFGFEFVGHPRMSIEDLGDGEPIIGHPTRLYRVTVSFVSQQLFRGQPCRRTTDTVELLWTATDVPRVERLRAYVRDIPPAPADMNSQVTDSLRRFDLKRERMIRGFILRSILTTRKPTPAGGRLAVVSKMEVTELVHGPIARSLFTVPEGYSTTPTLASSREGSSLSSIPGNPAETARIDSLVSAVLRQMLCDP